MNTKLLSDKSNNKTGFRSSPKAERTLCEMIVWSFTNEYLPLKRGANVPDAERKLAYKWIRLRRVHKFPSDPLRERIDKIEKLFKSKRTNPKRTLCEMVVWSFMHECFPRQEGANIPDYEKDLVREWYSLQYRYKSPNNPLRERIDKIEKLFKSKKIDPEQTLCEMVVWSFTHEYLPTRDTANVPYYEENLRHRWGALQSSYESLTAPLRERIDKIKKIFKSKKTDAERTLCEMVVWSFTHEYFPRRKGANVPDAEKDLERRWGKVQPNHKSPTDPLRGRIDKIKRFFKRKWTLIGPEQIIYEMVVWSFTHEYLPQQRMGNISNYERKLRQRWENLLQRYKSLVNSWRERTDSILSWVDSIDSLFKKMRNRGSRHLDTRSATGEQLASLAQEPREIVYHKDFLRQGTAILEGYFQTDRTNGFNPDGFNAPDGTPKHRKTYFDQSFTPEENQQAVEDVLYQDIQDLLRSIQSQTNFAMPKPNPRRTPPVREIHNENTRLYAITDALDLVQEYAGWITDADYELLQDAYLEAAAEPANIEKCRELVNVLKELQIQYLADKFAAFCLVLSDKYEKIIAQLRTIAVTSENISRITEAVTKLTLVKTRAVEDSELCKKYGITPAIVRQIRINLWKLAETRHLLKEILQETESLVHN